jgi:hypothetical protein
VWYRVVVGTDMDPSVDTEHTEVDMELDTEEHTEEHMQVDMEERTEVDTQVDLVRNIFPCSKQIT